MIGTFRAAISYILAAMIFSGCSGTNLPVSPILVSSSPALTQHTTDDHHAGSSTTTHYLWSYNLIFIDPSDTGNIEFEILPVRDVAAHWNVLQWLENGPCTDCFTIQGIVPSGSGTLLVDVEIKHPFSSPNLTGFDVRGIAMFSGSHDFPNSGLLTSDRNTGEGELVNADGFTTLYNPETAGSGPGGLQGYLKGKFASASYPNSTLNGYKRHYSPGAVNQRNAFYAGDSILETYEIAMPSGPFIFGYAVDANWAPPTIKPVTNPLTDFPPEANCPEAWKIVVSDSPIGQGLTDNGGSAVLTIDVYDWQGESTILSPKIECETLFDGWETASWLEDGTGYSRYTVTIENEHIAPVGEYKSLIVVEDTENASAPDWLDLTAYQIYLLDVYDFDNSTPVAKATTDVQEQSVCEPVYFTDNGSYDPDGGTITKYEWDWNNDGIFDEEGSDLYHAWNTAGTFQVQLRVTDDEDSTDTLDPPIQVNIVNALPTASAEADTYVVQPGEEVQFDGSASTDTDCGGISIVEWEWDWEGDGEFTGVGSAPVHSYDTEGTFYVQLQVTDDEGGTDLLDFPLKIQVSTDYFDPIPLATANTDYSHVCVPVEFSDDGSYDPDGGLVIAYEWDWDNDGVYDDQGKTVSHTWDSIGLYQVGFRVYDDEGASAVLDPPLEIIIIQEDPVAEATADKYVAFINEPIEFDGNASHDTDCDGHEIVGYQWDYNSDSVPDEYGSLVTESFPTNGLKKVSLTVEDDEAATAQANLEIDVNNGWARTWGGSNTDEADMVACDSAGNVYVLGTFWIGADFNPAEGTFYIETQDYSADIFLSKFDPNGNFLWAGSWGGSGDDTPSALAVGDSDSVYIAGSYSYTIDLDPGFDNTLATSNGQKDFFIVKLDSGDNFVWGYSVGGVSEDFVHDLEFSLPNNVLYYAGSYRMAVDFDPTGGTDNKATFGPADVFLTKLDSSGSYGWTRTWGAWGNDEGSALAIDQGANVVVAGLFEQSVDFNPDPDVDSYTSNGGYDIFLTKYYANGNYVWTEAWGGNDDDNVSSASGGSNYSETWVGGSFYGTVDLDPGPAVDNRTSNGDDDAYLSGFNSDGTRIFTRTWGGPSHDEVNSVWYHVASDRVIAAGSYEDSVDFDPGLGIVQATSNGGSDAFLSSFTWNGVFNWVDTWGGIMTEVCHGVTIASGSNAPIYTVGQFDEMVDFDPQDGIDNHYANSPPDAFLSRIPEDGQW